MNVSPPTALHFDPAQAIRLAQETFDIEAAAVLGLRSRVEGTDDGAFVRAVRLVLAVQGRVVVMGMGKSGHVGRKIAATLASTGTPAARYPSIGGSFMLRQATTPRTAASRYSSVRESDDIP